MDTPEPQPESVDAGTEYVVLQRVELTDRADAHAWMEIFRATARTPAIAAKIAHTGNDPATYRVVPTRSWNGVKVTPETMTTLKVEEA